MTSQSSLDCGDFVDSDDECDVEVEAEPRERYEEGVYCPIQIGEVLNNRYRIEHKLGWGGFSTVWLADDSQQGRKVALKILIHGQGQAECQIQRKIYNTVQDVSGLVLYEAAFSITGSGGNHHHLVLVYPVRGPNIRDFRLHNVSPGFRMLAAKQLLLALKSLHDAGFVHGDLSVGNVMWHTPNLDHWPAQKIYEQFGRPQKVSLYETDWKPGELVASMKIPTISLPIYIGDFGTTFQSGDVVKPTVQFPLPFCAPERLHGTAPSFASDMWSYMLIFLTFYFGGTVLTGDGTACVSRLVGMLGPFPEQWKHSYSGGSVWLDWWWDHTGQVAPPRMPLETFMEKLTRRRPEISPSERGYIISVVQKSLCYPPEQRITASELLDDPDFNGLMANYNL